jgi:hypothetical protein
VTIARLGRFGLPIGALVLVAFLTPRWPKPQRVRVILAEASAHVREVDERWRGGDDPSDEWMQTVSFLYPHGEAPRVVQYAPLLRDGQYVVEVELVTDTGRETIERQVSLNGDTASIDLSTAAVPSRKRADLAPSASAVRP